MPSSFQLTPRALDDLDEIWDYIAEDNVQAANRVESAILSACNSLAMHPMLGSKRSEITASAGSILDGNPLSQLHRGLPSRHKAVTGRRSTPWEEKHQGSP